MYKIKKLLCNPLTNKKLKPIIKFNGGRGAFLCHKCRKIIKQNLLKNEKGTVENLFCLDCATEIVMEIFKNKEYVNRPELSKES
jgi:hypothetical protein